VPTITRRWKENFGNYHKMCLQVDMLSKPTKVRVMMLSKDPEGRIHPRAREKSSCGVCVSHPAYVLTEPLDRQI
jgi:hypothetical protein